MKNTLKRIDEHLRTRMRIVIWKQWKTSEKRMWGLKKLNVSDEYALQSVGCCNHYQVVARTYGVRFGISKEVLNKRGLLSCLDYYLN